MTDFMRNKQGSVTIVALSLIVIFAMMAASLGFRSGLEVKLAKRHLDLFRERYLALAAVSAVEYLIEKDEDSEVDGPFDDWYNEPVWPEEIDFDPEVSVRVTDEEGKININFASEPLLEALFEIIGQEAGLETEMDKLLSAIMYWRGDSSIRGSSPVGKEYKNAPFEMLDELYLIDDIDPKDVPRIVPYLTVFGAGAQNQVKINPNTASPVVLEALVRSLAGDEPAKDDIIRGLLGLREELDGMNDMPVDEDQPESDAASIGYFTREEVENPELFHLKINLSNVDERVQVLVAQLLISFTTDSRFFHIHADVKENESSLGTHVDAVVGYPVPSASGRKAGSQRISRLRGLRRLGGAAQSDLTILTWRQV